MLRRPAHGAHECRGRRPQVRTGPAARVEAVERRVLLSAISGQVFNDLNGNGVKDTGDSGLPGSGLYLDLNGNGSYDANVATSTAASTDVPKSVPDSGPVTSVNVVNGASGSITHLTLTLNITHSADADLQLDLVSPAGTSVRLIDGVNDDGQNFTNTTLDDAAATAIQNGAAPFTGTFAPTTPLALFNGQNPNGTWKLQLQNSFSGDVATLNNWTLHFALGEPSAQADLGGNYQFSGLNVGTYTVRQIPQTGWTATAPTGGAATVAVNGTANATNVNFGQQQLPGALSGVEFNDLNANGRQDPGEPGRAGVTVYLDLNSNGQLDAGEPSTVTNSSGSWTLQAPRSGTYTVREVPQSGWASTGTTATVPMAGPAVNVSRRLGSQSDPAIAIDPTDPNRLFAIANEDPSINGLFTAVSNDGGATWQTRDLGNGLDGLPQAGLSPSATFDSFGNLYVAYVDSAGKTVEVVRSTDGGVSFSVVGSFSGDVSRPTVAAGPGGALSPGAIWVSWNQGGQVMASGAPVSGLGSAGSFAAPVAIQGASGAAGVNIAVGPAGQVALAWESDSTSSAAGPATIFRSIDPDGLGAQGFGAATAVCLTHVGISDPVPPQKSYGVDAEPSLAWDRSGGVYNGRLYLVYTDEQPATGSGNTDVFLRHSDDNGTTWSAPVRVNDDSTSAAQFLPRIAIDQTSGKLAASWYDARNDTGAGVPNDTDGIGNDDVEYYAAVSADGGSTFSPNLKLATRASNGSDAQNDLGLGDYTGLDFYAGRFYPVWADNANTTGDNPDGLLHGLDLNTSAVVVPGFAAGSYTVQAGPGRNVTGLNFGSKTANAVSVSNATITLSADSDGVDIDWTAGTQSGKVSAADPAGLTIDGSADTIQVSANAFPRRLTLGGTFSFSALSLLPATDILDIGKSTVTVPYSGASPLSVLQSYLRGGRILSSAAPSGSQYGIADIDKGGAVTLSYRLLGDVDGDGKVGFSDLLSLAQHYGASSAVAWDQGDLNYDGKVGFGDLLILAQHYGRSAQLISGSAAGSAGAGASRIVSRSLPA